MLKLRKERERGRRGREWKAEKRERQSQSLLQRLRDLLLHKQLPLRRRSK